VKWPSKTAVRGAAFCLPLHPAYTPLRPKSWTHISLPDPFSSAVLAYCPARHMYIKAMRLPGGRSGRTSHSGLRVLSEVETDAPPWPSSAGAGIEAPSTNPRAEPPRHFTSWSVGSTFAANRSRLTTRTAPRYLSPWRGNDGRSKPISLLGMLFTPAFTDANTVQILREGVRRNQSLRHR